MSFETDQYSVFVEVEKRSDEATVLRLIEMRQGEVSAKIRQAVETNSPLVDEFKATKMKISSFVLRLLHDKIE